MIEVQSRLCITGANQSRVGKENASEGCIQSLSIQRKAVWKSDKPTCLQVQNKKKRRAESMINKGNGWKWIDGWMYKKSKIGFKLKPKQLVIIKRKDEKRKRWSL